MSRRRPRGNVEAAAAGLLFAGAAVALFRPDGPLHDPARAGLASAALALLFVVLVGGYLALGVGAVAGAMQNAVRGAPARTLAGPAALWTTVLAYAAASGLPVAPRALAYAAYLGAPALLVAAGRTPGAGPHPTRVLAAAAALWLPVEFGALPPLPVPAPNGFDVSRFVGLVEALWLFLVAAPVGGVGYTLALGRRDTAVAVAVFAAYALVALPLGLATGFLAWNPRPDLARALAAPLVIFFVTAVPEEFLFRGLIQNALTRRWGPRVAFGGAAVVFGLAHLPDPRYVLLAAVAGVAYGYVYQRTGRITAAAVTHALVDAAWALLLRR